MKKERLFYLDFVRAIATISILLTHYNALFIYNTSRPMPEKGVITTYVANVYIGDWGVSLFLIISGAALMYVYEDKIDIVDFWKKRVLSIFPMFWLAYATAFLLRFYQQKSIPFAGIEKWRIIYSVLGLDGWLAYFGVSTMYIVGEWFLGFIIVIYIIFPMLRKLVIEHPTVTSIIFAILYIISVLKFGRGVLLFARLPEFLFGMYFVKYIKKTSWSILLLSITVLLLNSLLKPVFSESIQCTYVGIASFIVLVCLSRLFKFNLSERVCSVICKYSYPCFIVHHTIIYKMATCFDLNKISVGQSYMLFLCCVVAICFASVFLYRVEQSLRIIIWGRR